MVLGSPVHPSQPRPPLRRIWSPENERDVYEMLREIHTRRKAPPCDCKRAGVIDDQHSTPRKSSLLVFRTLIIDGLDLLEDYQLYCIVDNLFVSSVFDRTVQEGTHANCQTNGRLSSRCVDRSVGFFSEKIVNFLHKFRLRVLLLYLKDFVSAELLRYVQPGLHQI